MMNYVESEDLYFGKLFILNLTNFHPLLSFKFRYDPNFSRQDRFLLLFLKISLISFLSFILFRNIDIESTSDLALIDASYKKYKYPDISEMKAPIMCMFLLSFLLLPTPKTLCKGLFS